VSYSEMIYPANGALTGACQWCIHLVKASKAPPTMTLLLFWPLLAMLTSGEARGIPVGFPISVLL